MHLSCLPFAPRALPISLFFIWPQEYYVVRSTDHEAFQESCWNRLWRSPCLSSCNNCTTTERIASTFDTGEVYQTLLTWFNFGLKCEFLSTESWRRMCGWSSFTHLYLDTSSWVLRFQIPPPCLWVSPVAGPLTASSGPSENFFCPPTCADRQSESKETEQRAS
jgi:hypothetical protein